MSDAAALDELLAPMVRMVAGDVDPVTERLIVDGCVVATVRAWGPVTPEKLLAAWIAGLRCAIEKSKTSTFYGLPSPEQGFRHLVKRLFKDKIATEKNPLERALYGALYRGVHDLL